MSTATGCLDQDTSTGLVRDDNKSVSMTSKKEEVWGWLWLWTWYQVEEDYSKQVQEKGMQAFHKSSPCTSYSQIKWIKLCQIVFGLW